MHSYFRKYLAITLVGGIVGSMPVTACAEQATSNVDAAIKYRQGVMETIGANVGAIAGILKGELTQKDSLAQHARVLAIATGWTIEAFRQNTDGMGKEKTTAKKDVWQDWNKFESGLRDLQTDAEKVAALADVGDMDALGGALKSLAKNCKDCHDDFRHK